MEIGECVKSVLFFNLRSAVARLCVFFSHTHICEDSANCVCVCGCLFSHRSRRGEYLMRCEGRVEDGRGRVKASFYYGDRVLIRKHLTHNIYEKKNTLFMYFFLTRRHTTPYPPKGNTTYHARARATQSREMRCFADARMLSRDAALMRTDGMI